MKYATSEHTPTRQPKRNTRLESTDGEHAVSIAPPAYGLDFVDQGLATDLPVQRIAAPQKGNGKRLGKRTGAALGGAGEKVRLHFLSATTSGPLVQRKPVVNAVGGSDEREADRVSDQVMRHLNRSASRKPGISSANGDDSLELEADRTATIVIKRLHASGPSNVQSRNHLQRSPHRLLTSEPISPEGGEVDRTTERTINASSGARIDPVDRAPMESAFGTDFSHVRIHTGPKSDDLNDKLSARAFTSGSDIFVRSGEYSPGMPAGQKLLAHELTHVVQQGGERSIRRLWQEWRPDHEHYRWDEDVQSHEDESWFYDRPAKTYWYHVPSDLAATSPHDNLAGETRARSLKSWVEAGRKDVMDQIDAQSKKNWPLVTPHKMLLEKERKQNTAIIYPKEARPEQRGLANIGVKGDTSKKRPEDFYTFETGPIMDYTKPYDGDVVMNDEIPALAAALGYPGVTASDIGFGQTIRYWVVGGGASQPIPQLGGLKMRPVIMLSDVLAGGKGLVKNVDVYRGDSRGPVRGYPIESKSWKRDQPGILETGLRAYETDSDLLLHQRGWTNSSLDFLDDRKGAFVSTTNQISVATNFAKNGGWVYKMKVPYAINTTTALGRFAVTAYQSEDERSVPYAILPGQFTELRQTVGDEEQTIFIKSAAQVLEWARSIQKLVNTRKTDKGKQRMLERGHELRQQLVTPEELGAAFEESTGGGGGGIHGVDWKLISLAKDWETVASLASEDNVAMKTSLFEQAGLIDMLKTGRDKKNAQALDAAGAAGAPSSVRAMVKRKVVFVTSSKALLQDLEGVRGALKAYGMGTDASFVEAIRKDLAKHGKTAIGTDARIRLESVLVDLDQRHKEAEAKNDITTLRGIVRSGVSALKVNDKLLQHLEVSRSQLKAIGLDSDATFIETIRKRLVKERAINLTDKDRERIEYIWLGLGVHT